MRRHPLAAVLLLAAMLGVGLAATDAGAAAARTVDVDGGPVQLEDALARARALQREPHGLLGGRRTSGARRSRRAGTRAC